MAGNLISSIQKIVNLHTPIAFTLDIMVRFLRIRAHKPDGDRSIRDLSTYFAHIVCAEEREKAILDAKLRYYEFARREVDREDGISFQRLNLALVFRGFIVTSIFLLASSSTPVALLIYFLNALCVVGFLTAYFAFHGIDSSRRSLLFAKDQWVAFNRVNGEIYPSMVPQLTKRANRHSYDGALFKRGIVPDGQKDKQDMENSKTSRVTEREMLEPRELQAGSFFDQRNRSRTYRDEGWDFAISIPLMLMVFWLSTLAMLFMYGNEALLQSESCTDIMNVTVCKK